MAARGSDLPGVTTALMLEHMMEGYQSALLHPVADAPPNADAGDDLAPIHVVLQSALRRRWKHLADERIDDVEPTVPLGKRFWKLSDAGARSAIEQLFAEDVDVAAHDPAQGAATTTRKVTVSTPPTG